MNNGGIDASELAYLEINYDRYFRNLDAIEEINHLPPEVMVMFGADQEVLLIEGALGIGSKCIQRLYPICSKIVLEGQDVRLLNMASQIILFLNGEHYTAWNVRRKLFDLKNLNNELKLIELVSIKFPSCSAAYAFRLHCRSMVPDQAAEDRFFRKSLAKKNRNYNLWTYRLSLITNDQAALRKEVQFCQDLAGQQIHNHSLFHHLMIMLQRLNDSSLNRSVLSWADDLLIRFTLMYEGQENPQELDIVHLSSLKRFVEILSKTK